MTEGEKEKKRMESKEESCVYKNPDAPVEARVQDLLSRMSLAEKIGQMTQIERVVTTRTVITNSFIGSVLNGGGSWPFEDARPSDWADMIDGYQNAALASRLGIPIIYGIDAVHGNNNVYGATIFPHNIGLGATRDADLIRRIGAATALEVRAMGAHWAFAPCVAALRNPRWGRSYECYSEDANTICELLSRAFKESHPKNTLMVTLFLREETMWLLVQNTSLEMVVPKMAQTKGTLLCHSKTWREYIFLHI